MEWNRSGQPGHRSATKRSPRRFKRISRSRAYPKWTEEEHKFARELQKSLNKKEEGLATKVAPLSASRQNSSSNDIGDITWVVPSATVRFPSATPGVQAHHWTAGIAPTMSIAHKGAVVGAKVMAAFGSRPAHFG